MGSSRSIGEMIAKRLLRTRRETTAIVCESPTRVDSQLDALRGALCGRLKAGHERLDPAVQIAAQHHECDQPSVPGS